MMHATTTYNHMHTRSIMEHPKILKSQGNSQVEESILLITYVTSYIVLRR